ncbi:aminoacyl-tRNA deacylase and HDOD domain-containing protein [Teredinibacter turnerae]|uniref:aminoacyl-tRNA deacylase and HDOD domain-containing protein n=1 Tax=Teredinibacter turnerae TaxID=2426 RepID=UPI000419CDAB|nr:HDOD domain-containing protein [Teredinibacter turnerae]
MSLPASIQEMLDTQKVNYNIAPMDRSGHPLGSSQMQNICVVQSVLLQDAHGRVQVLLPAGSLVDLESLSRHTERNFEGVNLDDVRPLLQQQQLSCVPALPRWQSMPTVVDERLVQASTLWLESGTGTNMLELSRADFQSIIATSEVLPCALDAPVLSFDGDKEEAQILDSVKRFTQKRVKQRLDETLELPPLPETAQRIIKLRADPNADISDLANIVEIDPSLAAQVVSWAASPYYSAPGRIKSVHDAIVRVLGFDMVLNLALGLSLGKTVNMQVLAPQQIARYWRDAVYSAAAVEGLVTSIERPFRPGFGMAYLSGLLSNFGYLILADVFPPYFTSIERMAKANSHVPSACVEQHQLGMTGNQIAAWLMDNWNMPEEVVIALRHLHNPNYQGEHAVYSKLVGLAQQMLANAGFGNRLTRPITDHAFAELHLDPETARITVENILEAGDDLDAIAEKMRA